MAKIVSRGDPIEPVYLNNLRVAAHGWGVISGLAVSQRGAGANMSVDVASGEAWINGTRVTKSSTTNVAITAAHASYDRYDLVVINSSGTISVIDGTAAATSYANDYDLEINNAILLAEVYVPATDTTIEDAQITDKQIIIYETMSAYSEDYSNHLWALDNFLETGTSGNGTAAIDEPNHEMDLSAGVTVAGAGYVQTVKQYTPDTDPLICEFIVDNKVDGVGGTERNTFIGLKDNFGEAVGNPYAVFKYDSDTNDWRTRTYESGLEENIIADIVDDDVLMIVLTSSNIYFYVNDVVVATHTTQIPDSGMNVGAKANTVTIAATTANSISIDKISIKKY